MSEAERYEVPIEVRPDDIDKLGHVNNVVYLRWVQEAAVAHWETLATAEDRESIFWVVSRHELDYLRPAYLDTDVVARTWVGTATRRKFERHTEIVRASDDRVLVRARTLWVPVDTETLRPTDVTESVRSRFSVNDAD